MVYVDFMLISILSVSVEALEMLCTVVAEALAPQACDLKADDLLRPLASCNVCFESQTKSCTP